MTAPAHDRAPARTPAWWMFWGSLASVGYAYLGFSALAVVRGLLLREERSSPVSGWSMRRHEEGRNDH